jgi:hypothetical protein
MWAGAPEYINGVWLFQTVQGGGSGQTTTAATPPSTTTTSSHTITGSVSPTTTASLHTSGSNGLQQSDIIAIGVGLGVGIPSLIVAILGVWYSYRMYRKH